MTSFTATAPTLPTPYRLARIQVLLAWLITLSARLRARIHRQPSATPNATMRIGVDTPTLAQALRSIMQTSTKPRPAPPEASASRPSRFSIRRFVEEAYRAMLRRQLFSERRNEARRNTRGNLLFTPYTMTASARRLRESRNEMARLSRKRNRRH